MLRAAPLMRGVSQRKREDTTLGHSANVEEPSATVSGTRPGGSVEAPETPEERLEQAYQSIRADVASDLLSRVKAASPRFFENLVVELLLKMGYGRSRAAAGRYRRAPACRLHA